MRSRRTLGPRLQALGLLGASTAAARFLHGLASEPWARIDTGDLTRWLTTTPAEDAVAALLRVAAVGTCWWLAASVALAIAARVVHWRPAAALVDRWSLPAVRRIADRAAGGGLVLATLLGPAAPALAAAPPPMIVPADAPPPPGLVPPGTAAPPAPTAPGPAAAVPPPATVAPGEPDGGAGRSVVAQRGDHLWSIARAEVGRATGRAPASLRPSDVAPYWAQVVAANHTRLRSGDPDLVRPGERIALPPYDHPDPEGPGTERRAP